MPPRQASTLFHTHTHHTRTHHTHTPYTHTPYTHTPYTHTIHTHHTHTPYTHTFTIHTHTHTHHTHTIHTHTHNTFLCHVHGTSVLMTTPHNIPNTPSEYPTLPLGTIYSHPLGCKVKYWNMVWFDDLLFFPPTGYTIITSHVRVLSY